jgi:tryptophan synthase beta chain
MVVWEQLSFEWKNFRINMAISRHWLNLHTLCKSLGLKVLPQLDPNTHTPMSWEQLALLLPSELAKQELNAQPYADELLIPIPPQVSEQYERYRPTPFRRAAGLEQALGLSRVRIYFKDETATQVGSYKPNAALAQAFYTKLDGATTLVGDTVPANWGLALAEAGRLYDLNIVILMEQKHYERQHEKVKRMRSDGAEVLPITTENGTIAESLSAAAEYVLERPGSKLAVGCIANISAMQNTVIGLEMEAQMTAEQITPDVCVGVIGGGSSFSGMVFPMLRYAKRARFIAVESNTATSFSHGEYRYGSPDRLGLLPQAMMYTLGSDYVPNGKGAGGVQNHARNALLSLLRHEGYIEVATVDWDQAVAAQKLFAETERIMPAAESSLGIAEVIRQAKLLQDETKTGSKTVVFTLTGRE